MKPHRHAWGTDPERLPNLEKSLNHGEVRYLASAKCRRCKTTETGAVQPCSKDPSPLPYGWRLVRGGALCPKCTAALDAWLT